MSKWLLFLMALSAFAARTLAGIHDDPLHRPMTFPVDQAPLLKMKVYLKDGSRTPPMDSFRLAQGKSEIWRWENESAIFRRGRKVAHRLADIDSVVVDKHGMALPDPAGKSLLFLREAGAINFYALDWRATDLPRYLKKGDGPLLRARTGVISEMVADDPEAAALMERYRNRWRTRLIISAAGAGLLAGGLALAVATTKEDENGERKPSTVVPGVMALAGLVTFAVPLTPLVNFIWNPLPKRSLDTYNRNRRTSP